MKELFRNKNYVLLFAGSLVSELGNVLFAFVAGLYVADITGRESMLAIFMALGAGVRVLVSPLAGVIIDRLNKIKIIYLTDYFRGLMFIVVAYFFWMGVTQTQATAILLVVVGVSGLISAMFGPAVTAATPEIVGLDLLQQANGANSIINSLTAIVGVLFGILAFALFSFEFAVFLNGISFVISGFSEMFIKAIHKQEVPQTKHTFFKDMAVGFSYIKKKEGILSMLMYLVFINLAIAPIFNVAIPSLLRIQLQRSAWEIGWVNIAISLAMMISGVIIGGIKLKKLSRTIKLNLLFVVISMILLTINIFLLSINAYSYWIFYALLVLIHIFIGISLIGVNVPFNTSLVKIVEPELRGRVFSTFGAVAGALAPVAIVAGGFIIEKTSVSVLGFICSLVMLIPTIGLITNKRVHNLLEGIERDTNGKAEATSPELQPENI